MKTPFVLSIAIHVLAVGALFLALNGRSNSMPPVPAPSPVDPAPVEEMSEEDLEALDHTIAALEEDRKPAAGGGRTPSRAPAEPDANDESSSPAPSEIKPPVEELASTPAWAATPAGTAQRIKYASAATKVPIETASGITVLPQIAVEAASSENDPLPAGENGSVTGLRAPRALFVNVLPTDIDALLSGGEARALIDLPDRTSYLYGAKKVVLCSSRDQFLAFAERAISIKTSSRIGAAIVRDAGRPLKAQEGVDPAELAKATITLVWTIPIDAAILQGQRDAAATLGLPFDQVIATRGLLELSQGKFARYRITEAQLKDRRLVPLSK